MVSENPDEADFEGPREFLIGPAEEALGLSFPPSYRRFVGALGAGSIAGIELYGLINSDFENSGVPDVVWMTRRARREWGLPDTAIVIYFDGGISYYIIDVSKAGGGEPPVEVWVPGHTSPGDPLETVFPSFGAMARQLVEEGLG